MENQMIQNWYEAVRAFLPITLPIAAGLFGVAIGWYAKDRQYKNFIMPVSLALERAKAAEQHGKPYI